MTMTLGCGKCGEWYKVEGDYMDAVCPKCGYTTREDCGFSDTDSDDASESSEERCEYCDWGDDDCECVRCWKCDANITELIDESSDPQGEIDWEHPCLNCEKKCDRLWSKGVPTWSQQKLRELPVEWSNPYEKPHDWEFLFTNGWKQDKEGKDDDVEGCRFKITMIRAS